ncbi:MAG TPA: hypothetical protein VHL77_08340 [Ferruginibacter sp.]|jgi:hypothetical protein|nr:hypothetical protein [Ferruginibacter sp.]
MLTKLAARNPYWYAAIVPAILSWISTAFSVLVLKDYGMSVFILIPLFIGACSTVFYGKQKPSSIGSYISLAVVSLLIYCAGLILFALEGLICIVMAAPLGIAIAAIGCCIGQIILNYRKNSSIGIIIGFAVCIPAAMSFESVSKDDEDVFSVTTSVVIDQKPEAVWNKVVAFSKMDPPEEWLFRVGIAYPTDAVIKHTGSRTIRYCNFSTGCFVEPITTWQEPNLLAFTVEETPRPLQELSPYNIDPAHLHGYFVSKKGQFQLTALPNGKTLLTGTTWYAHKIKPAFYWRFWSNYIIHKIHNRVLAHIKKEAEAM